MLDRAQRIAVLCGERQAFEDLLIHSDATDDRGDVNDIVRGLMAVNRDLAILTADA